MKFQENVKKFKRNFIWIKKNFFFNWNGGNFKWIAVFSGNYKELVKKLLINIEDILGKFKKKTFEKCVKFLKMFEKVGSIAKNF